MRKIILASQSPNRKALLEKTGLPFIVEESGYEEDLGLKLSPPALAKKMAVGKAEMVAKRHKDAIVIGADTFVIFGKQLLGKPHTAPRARQVLGMLCGKWHRIITGYAIIDSKTGKRHVGSVVTRVHMRKASKQEIDAYVRTGEPLKVAGAYAMQSGAASLVDRVEGDVWSIVGLPLAKVVIALKEFGITIR